MIGRIITYNTPDFSKDSFGNVYTEESGEVIDAYTSKEIRMYVVINNGVIKKISIHDVIKLGRTDKEVFENYGQKIDL